MRLLEWLRRFGRRTPVDELLAESAVCGRIGPGAQTQLMVFTGADSMVALRDVARDLEASGDRPSLRFYLDHQHRIAGVVLSAELSSRTAHAISDDVK